MHRVSSVSIAEAAMEDRALLEELIAAALNDALEQARAGAQETAGQLLARLAP
jgi:DNA-binding protein YbaB